MIILPLAFLTMAATPTRTTGAGVVAMMSDGDGDSVTKLLASLPVLDLLALLFLQEIRFCVILSSKTRTRQKKTRRRGEQTSGRKFMNRSTRKLNDTQKSTVPKVEEKQESHRESDNSGGWLLSQDVI